jgi:hypothetical protein
MSPPPEILPPYSVPHLNISSVVSFFSIVNPFAHISSPKFLGLDWKMACPNKGESVLKLTSQVKPSIYLRHYEYWSHLTSD